MTKQELINKIDGLEISEELKVELMGDVSDVEAVEGVSQADYNTLKAERDDYEKRYNESIAAFKARFMNGDAHTDGEDETHEEKEEESVIIDVKEI